ncbi:Uncharacterised protein [Bordetella pertussis]|nr:Uncharacterised protein [Bordetella pertussis]
MRVARSMAWCEPSVMMICSGSQSIERVRARCWASASRSAGRPPP